MAYASTITQSGSEGPPGSPVTRWYTISETDCAAASEYEISGLPTIVTIVALHAELTSGSGTTIQPELGAAASWTDDTVDERLVVAAAAANVAITAASERRTLILDGGILRVRSTPDSGTDNAVTTQIAIVEGVI